MAQFLAMNGINCLPEKIIKTARERLVLVSPYKGQLLMKALKEIHALWPFIVAQ